MVHMYVVHLGSGAGLTGLLMVHMYVVHLGSELV